MIGVETQEVCETTIVTRLHYTDLNTHTLRMFSKKDVCLQDDVSTKRKTQLSNGKLIMEIA